LDPILRVGKKNGRLELGLRLEVLRFRLVPPPRKNTKGKEGDIKLKRFFCLIKLCFF
jgi:hypothetical protein